MSHKRRIINKSVWLCLAFSPVLFSCAEDATEFDFLDSESMSDDWVSVAETLTTTSEGERSRCKSLMQPRLIYSDDVNNIYTFYDLNRDVLFSNAIVESPAYDEYIAWLDEKNMEADVDVFDQRAVLIRQRDVFVKYLGEEHAYNFDLILDGRAGILSPMNCLQSIIFDIQNREHPLSEAPSEGLGAILRRKFADFYVFKIYAQTEGDYIPSTEKLREFVAKDVAAGWEWFVHMHNHPFMFDGPFDIAGTVIPSSPDLAAYESHRNQFGLKVGWITNGLDSLHLDTEEVDLFRQDF
ncbi:MAG: hypothetical protein MJE77_47015 [Proteobacteria bacterium]|nr:hypothetical protein [Pseudomonadota bacterium]